MYLRRRRLAGWCWGSPPTPMHTDVRSRAGIEAHGTNSPGPARFKDCGVGRLTPLPRTAPLGATTGHGKEEHRNVDLYPSDYLAFKMGTLNPKRHHLCVITFANGCPADPGSNPRSCEGIPERLRWRRRPYVPPPRRVVCFVPLVRPFTTNFDYRFDRLSGISK